MYKGKLRNSLKLKSNKPSLKMEIDWQIKLTNIKERCQHILVSEQLADCQFLVGKSPNQRLFKGHRLILAMSSPVFQRMFNEDLTKKNAPIPLPDVQPAEFEAMLSYLYTDEFPISSFDNACAIYSVAKTYMLPIVVEACREFLLVDLNPNNACLAYEFAKLHEDPSLMESSMEYIAHNTQEVMAAPSFKDIEVSTMMAILDRNQLNIDNELDLFNCLLKIGKERGILNSEKEKGVVVVVKKIKLDPVNSSSEAASTSAGTSSSVPNVAVEVVTVDSSASASGNGGDPTVDINNLMDAQVNSTDEAMLRQAVKKIRFLTMTTQQFTEGPARSKLLQKDEVLAILLNISSPTLIGCPMPEGFSQLNKRDRVVSCPENRYCISASDKFHGYSNETNSYLSFKVNKNINLLGVQIKLQHSYQRDVNKGFSACIQCCMLHGPDIAYTDSMKAINGSTYEFTFKSPVSIHRNLDYKIKIIDKHGYGLVLSSWNREMICQGVRFNILEANPDGILKSSISSIIFAT